MVNPLINLYRTKEEALSFKDSQLNSFYNFNGIHLLPNNLTPYIQVTNTPDGINLEDWTVYGVDVYSGQKTTITGSFMVEYLTNSMNGDPQFIWSLTNVPIDFGYGLIYLEIQQIIGETFYSTPFLLTNYNKEKTSQFHYKQKRTDKYQSIGMQSWFRQPNQMITLTNYYETSNQKTVTSAITKNTTEIHVTEVMSINQLIRLVDIISSPYVYLEGIRSSLYTAPEIPKVKGDENFGTLTFEVTLNENDKYKGDEIIPVITLPLAVNDNYTVSNTGNSTLYVLYNDELGMPQTLITYLTQTNITTGSLTVSTDGQSIIFTPNGTTTTGQTFNYTITDSNGNTSTATVTLIVNALPNQLLAVNDNYSLVSLGVQTMLVLGNDLLGTTPTNIISINQSSVTTGVITISGNGQNLIFTPNGGVTASESFTYTIQDSTMATSAATVIISVTASAYVYELTSPNSNSENACAFDIPIYTVYQSSPDLNTSLPFYTNPELTILFVGVNQFYKVISLPLSIRLNSVGMITGTHDCL
jgi:hypothetical protein